jgi:hypothetical protein
LDNGIGLLDRWSSGIAAVSTIHSSTNPSIINPVSSNVAVPEDGRGPDNFHAVRGNFTPNAAASSDVARSIHFVTHSDDIR